MTGEVSLTGKVCCVLYLNYSAISCDLFGRQLVTRKHFGDQKYSLSQLFSDLWDWCQYLSNDAPTLPLTKYYSQLVVSELLSA